MNANCARCGEAFRTGQQVDRSPAGFVHAAPCLRPAADPKPALPLRLTIPGKPPRRYLKAVTP